jgi:alpha-L-rhamnosidase
MFGGGLIWFYRNLAGMQADPQLPGYRHIIFKPQAVEELKYVTYNNNTVYGEGGITWRNEKDAFVMEITVPVSTYATVYVPATDLSQITERGTAPDLSTDVLFKEIKDGYALFNVESGNYRFRVSK